MYNTLTSIYSAYKNVYFVNRDIVGLSRVADVMKIDEDSVKPICANRPINALFECCENSLVVVDVNSVGITDTNHFLFLLSCFFPKTGVVLLANDLPKRDKERYLASSVVAIIKGADPTAVAAVA